MEKDHIAYYRSPLGVLTLHSDGEYLVGVSFGGPEDAQTADEQNGTFDPVLKETVGWLDLYFARYIPDFTPPIRLRVSPFCAEVCEHLLAIPYGQTTTYGEIAKELASRRGIPKMSAQAVGGAVGRNPVAILIPCHRVIGAHGEMVGYGGGLERKIKLLELEKSPKKEDLVPLSVYLPEAIVDLRYAGQNNFTGKAVYDSGEAYLRYGSVLKLKAAAKELKKSGRILKIWDAYRPIEAQFKLWEICPDPRFVADPHSGFSNHSRGGTVDLTLCDKDWNEVEMPSGFDDFSERASRNYNACSAAAAYNARLLETVMTSCGFSGYDAEWWHYDDTDVYEVVYANNKSR